MRKRKLLSERTPSELMKIRIISATLFATLGTLLNHIATPGRSISKSVFLGIFVWLIWFLFWHKGTMWLERKFSKK